MSEEWDDQSGDYWDLPWAVLPGTWGDLDPLLLSRSSESLW